jgi:hypothetical protein
MDTVPSVNTDHGDTGQYGERPYIDQPLTLESDGTGVVTIGRLRGMKLSF